MVVIEQIEQIYGIGVHSVCSCIPNANRALAVLPAWCYSLPPRRRRRDCAAHLLSAECKQPPPPPRTERDESTPHATLRHEIRDCGVSLWAALPARA